MIIDDVIWEIINNGQCSYKNKTETNTFCSDPNNVTGLCNRNSCPLSNSRYSTITEQKGVCYLKLKTAERAHTPAELWETIKLPASYKEAMELIDKELQYWPKFLIHKCKQRFTRIRQVLVKRRKIKLEGSQEYQLISRKAEKREKSRLVKAEKAAVIENHISEELLKNLRNGKYNDIYNFDKNVFKKILEKEKAVEEYNVDEDFNEEDYDKGFIDDYDDEDDNEEQEGNDNEGDNENQGEEDEDNFDDIFGEDNKSSTTKDKSVSSGSKIGKKRGRKKINLEYEKEYEHIKKNYNVDEE